MIDELRKTAEISLYERINCQKIPVKTISNLLLFINKANFSQFPPLTYRQNYGNCQHNKNQSAGNKHDKNQPDIRKQPTPHIADDY